MKKWQGLLCFLLIFSFQNCSPVLFQQASDSVLLKSSNSGVPYGGMQKGDYYRFVPDFTCDQNGTAMTAPVSSLEVTDTSVTLTENKKLLCGANKQTLDPALIDSSIYQNEVIGYQEGIFEGEPNTPTSIPANLVEVWCRDRNDDQGIETITHFDRNSNQAVNRIYYSINGLTQQISDFSVARVLGQNTIIIKDDQGFELTVYRDQPAAQLGLFKAHMDAVIDHRNVKRETACRLGGSVDPKLWPTKQIVDFNVQNFKISPNKQYFSYLVSSGNTIYSANINGSNQTLVNSDGFNTLSFDFTPDSNSLIVTTDNKLESAYNLIKVSLDGTSKTLLNTSNNETLKGVTKDFKFTPDGTFILYKDGTPGGNGITAPWNPLAKWLQLLPLTGGTPLVLNPPLIDTPTGVSSYDVSAKKIVFICCNEGWKGPNIGADLYSVNYDGTNLIKITPPAVPGVDGPFFANEQLQISKDEKHVFIGNYAVALDGSGFTEFPTGWSSTLVSPSGQYTLLTTPTEAKLMSLQTKNFTATPPLKIKFLGTPDSVDTPLLSTFFTQDSASLIARKILSDGKLQAVAISTSTGVTQDLCPGVTAPNIFISEVNANTFLILTYDQKNQILNVYQSSTHFSCTKLNSVVVSHSNVNEIREVILSPDKQKIIARLSLVTPGTVYNYLQNSDIESTTQLFYIPLDGHPSYLVNTPVYDLSSITQVLFLGDSTSIIYVGDQLRPKDSGVFIWSAPKTK